MKIATPVILITACLCYGAENNRILSTDQFDWSRTHYDEELRFYLPDEKEPFSGIIFSEDPEFPGPGEHRYQSGLLEGYQVWWRSEAKRIPQLEYYTKNGLKHGLLIWYTYHPSGPGYEPMKNIIVKSVNHYREGVLHGYSIAYHRDGTLRSRFHYDQGYEHGECTLWDESGELKYSGAYYRGFRDGGWKIKQKDGSFENVSYDGIASFKRLIELADISEEEYFRAKLLEAKYEMHIDKIPSELRDEVLLLWKSISDARYEILESQQAVAINSEAAASPR